MAIPKTRVATFDPVPSIQRTAAVTISVSTAVPTGAGYGVPVGVDGAMPSQLGLNRATLVALGFDGQVGQTLVLPRTDGPPVVAVGIGVLAELDESDLREAAAAYARAAGASAQLITTLADVGRVPPAVAGQVVVEGVLLARYHYDAFKPAAAGPPLNALTLVVAAERVETVTQGAARGRQLAAAAQLARDLANTPPAYLTASRMAEVATGVAAEPRARGRGVRQGRAGRAGLRRPARRQRGQRRAAAHDPADAIGPGAGETRRPAAWPWSARASCTTRAGSA